MAEQTQGPPNWLQYLGQVQQMTGPRSNVAAYPAGTPTMDYRAMKSREGIAAADRAAQLSMHADQMALDREKLALNEWIAQQEVTLARMEFEAAREAARASGTAGPELDKGTIEMTADDLANMLFNKGYANLSVSGSIPGLVEKDDWSVPREKTISYSSATPQTGQDIGFGYQPAYDKSAAQTPTTKQNVLAKEILSDIVRQYSPSMSAYNSNIKYGSDYLDQLFRQAYR